MQLKTVQPPLKFIPPAFTPWVVKITHKLVPLWLRYHRGISHVQAKNVQRLVELYQQFQLGKTRFIIAFRHPSLDDPPCLYHLLGSIVPQVAKQQNIALHYPIHAHFIYERGVTLWAGKLAGWLFSRLGATPIYRGKLDMMGLRVARHLFANSSLAMAAAPEGTINCCSERVNPLEPGVAQLGFWCVEDLLRERRENVVILPVGIKYYYVYPDWQALESAIARMETDCSLPPAEPSCREAATSRGQWLWARLYRLAEYLLSLLEDFYTRFHHQSLSGAGSLDERLQAFQNAALSVAESNFGLQPKGSLMERRHRIEQAGWDWIYRQDIPNVQALSNVEQGVANRIVEMVNLYLWHLRLADSLWAVNEQYVLEKFSFERLAEITLQLWELLTHLQGGDLAKRPNFGQRCADITIGEAISVSERWNDYRRNRRQAVDALTLKLQTALQETIGSNLPPGCKRCDRTTEEVSLSVDSTLEILNSK